MIFLLRRRVLMGLAVIPLFCLGTIWGRLLARKTTPIAIDPGHGGIDGGCQDGQGNLEKDLNLALALLVAEKLRQKGYPVFLTREDDRDLGPTYRQDLLARVEKARAAGAGLMVSLHANWSFDPAVEGALALIPPGSPRSELLARSILHRLRAVCPITPEPVIRGDHTLLNAASFPIALVEVGFLSNPAEARRLQEPSYRRALAAAIAAGIEDYLHTKEERPADHPPSPGGKTRR